MKSKAIVAAAVWLIVAAAPVLAAEKALTPQEITGQFIAVVKAGTFPEAARDKVLELWAAQQKAKTLDQDFIQNALKILYVDYSRAVLRIDADRLEEADAILAKLAEKPDTKYLAAGIEYEYARMAARKRNWELAVERLEKIRGAGELADYALQKEKIDLAIARAYARIARIDEAIEIVKKLPDSEETRQLLARLEVERDVKDMNELAILDDTAEHMGDVKKKLDAKETGKPTRDKQERIVAMLDLLIERIQNQENQSSGGGGGGGGGGGSQPGSSGGSGPPSGTGVPSSPATQSALPGGPSNDEGTAAKTATMADFWANLSAKQRASVLDALRKDFPRRYHDLIEAYYKSMTEGEKK